MSSVALFAHAPRSAGRAGRTRNPLALPSVTAEFSTASLLFLFLPPPHALCLSFCLLPPPEGDEADHLHRKPGFEANTVNAQRNQAEVAHHAHRSTEELRGFCSQRHSNVLPKKPQTTTTNQKTPSKQQKAVKQKAKANTERSHAGHRCGQEGRHHRAQAALSSRLFHQEPNSFPGLRRDGFGGSPSHNHPAEGP